VNYELINLECLTIKLSIKPNINNLLNEKYIKKNGKESDLEKS
jgi:hypothetical protein